VNEAEVDKAIEGRYSFSIQSHPDEEQSRTNRMRVNANSPHFNLFEAFGFSALVALVHLAVSGRVQVFLACFFPPFADRWFSLHRDTPKTVGWRADNLRACDETGALFFVHAFCSLCHRNPARRMHRWAEASPGSQRFFAYTSFCLLQQVALNSTQQTAFSRQRIVLPAPL